MRGNLHFILHCNITRLNKILLSLLFLPAQFGQLWQLWLTPYYTFLPYTAPTQTFRFHVLSLSSTFNWAQTSLALLRQPGRGTVLQQMQDQPPEEAVPKKQCPQDNKLLVAWSPFLVFLISESLKHSRIPALLPRVSHFHVSASSSQQGVALIYEKTVTKTSSQAFSVLEHGA